MKSVKINKIGFKNYKVFDDVKINLNQCNVFVGPNSSGKSSIAEFLIFFRELIRLFSVKDAKLDYNYLLNFLNNAFKIGKNQPLTFETEVIIGNYSYNYFAEFSTRYDTDAVWANERLVITQIRNNYIILEVSMKIIKDDFPKLESIMKFKGRNIDEENNYGGSITYTTSSILRYENFKKFEKKRTQLFQLRWFHVFISFKSLVIIVFEFFLLFFRPSLYFFLEIFLMKSNFSFTLFVINRFNCLI